MSLRETLTRRNLPHWFVPHAWHFVTYRLAGTIPSAVLHRMREERDQRWRQAQAAGEGTPAMREQLHKQFFAAYDRHLDGTNKIDWLARPKVAAMIRGNLYHHRGVKYDLLAYCVMPNHVHVLLQPIDPGGASSQAGSLRLRGDKLPACPPEAAAVFADEVSDSQGPLAKIMHSLKSYTANEANKLLGRDGPFWQHESYDHWVRDEEELERIVYYIAWNPVKAGLVKMPHEWYFGSAHDRFLCDGSEEGYLALPE